MNYTANKSVDQALKDIDREVLPASIEDIKAQAEILKGLLVEHGVCDIGRANVSLPYTIRDVIEDHCDENFFLALNGLFAARESEENLIQAANKLTSALGRLVDTAAYDKAKSLLGAR